MIKSMQYPAFFSPSVPREEVMRCPSVPADAHATVVLSSAGEYPAGGCGCGVVQGVCADLSGGGCRVRVDESVAVHSSDNVLVDLTEFLPDVPPLEGTVQRILHSDDNGTKKDLGIMFTNISNADIDKIVKLVFRHQILQRKQLTY